MRLIKMQLPLSAGVRYPRLDYQILATIDQSGSLPCYHDPTEKFYTTMSEQQGSIFLRKQWWSKCWRKPLTCEIVTTRIDNFKWRRLRGYAVREQKKEVQHVATAYFNELSKSALSFTETGKNAQIEWDGNSNMYFSE